MRILLPGLAVVLSVSACATTPDLFGAQTPLVKPNLESRSEGDGVLWVGERSVRGLYCERSGCDVAHAVPLADQERTALEEALQETWRVIRSESFLAHVRADNAWFAAVGNENPISGARLLDVYPGHVPSFTVLVKNGSLGAARAETSVEPPVITISASVLKEWSDPKEKPAVINTLAHEMSHLIAQTVGEGVSYAFLDGGFSAHPCKQIDLVSYKLGHMAQCTYSGRSGADFDACVDSLHREMAIPWYTLAWGWWRAFCPTYGAK